MVNSENDILISIFETKRLRLMMMMMMVFWWHNYSSFIKYNLLFLEQRSIALDVVCGCVM